MTHQTVMMIFFCLYGLSLALFYLTSGFTLRRWLYLAVFIGGTGSYNSLVQTFAQTAVTYGLISVMTAAACLLFWLEHRSV